MGISYTHISKEDFDSLCEVFARLEDDGNWHVPEWLAEWGVRLNYLNEQE